MLPLTINKRVLQKVSPIALGYLVLGMACGVLGEKAQLSPWQMFVLSTLAYAGSAQFIGIAMMLQGAGFFSIGLTILVVNLRSVLFSSTLAPFLSKHKLPFLALFSHGITDETFAVNLAAWQKEATPPWTAQEALGINVIGSVVWSFSNCFGCYAAEFLKLDLALVSYILTAMFLGIWANYLISRTMIITGLASGILAVILAQLVPYKLHIVLASLLCSGLACYLTLRYKGGDKHDI